MPTDSCGRGRSGVAREVRSLVRPAVLLTVALMVSSCAYISRVSVDPTGGDANGPSLGVSISDDGRHVAFDSGASDLVPGDHNGVQDVFVSDLRVGTTTRVSIDALGGDAAGSSLSPSISDNGRHVAFESFANDLLPGANSMFSDVFVRDLPTGTTTLISVTADGGDATSGSNDASISADGRYVAFHSGATNLVPGGSAAGNVFLRDRQAGTTTQVSVDSNGGDPNGLSISPVVSGTGRYVAFASFASDLVPGDTNGLADVFVRDLVAGTTIRASVDNAVLGVPTVESTSPSISDDGRLVAFVSTLADSTGEFVDTEVFVRDVMAETTTLVSVDTTGAMPSGASGRPSIGGDGRYVAFQSDVSTLVVGDGNDRRDVFVRDLHAGTTARSSVDAFGGEANGDSGNPSMSGDGRYVAFNSMATDLVSGDGTSGFVGTDVFVRAASTPTIHAVTPAQVARGATALLTVSGSGFLPGTLVAESVFQPGGLHVNDVTVVSETELLVSVTADNEASPGGHTLMVFNPGTGPGAGATGFGFCGNCLAVT